MEATRFILLFQGRSGSTWLIDKLSSHPAAIVKGEALVELLPAGAEGQQAWVQKFFMRARPSSCHAVGFKSKLSDVLDPSGFAEVLRQTGCRILHLDRENIVKQAISWMRADLLYNSIGVHNVRAPGEKAPPTSLDPRVFAKRLSDLERGRRALAIYVGSLGLPTCRIIYEALAADPATELIRIQSFLNLAPLELQSDYIKHTPNDLSETVTNLHELRASVLGTDWMPMFDTD